MCLIYPIYLFNHANVFLLVCAYEYTHTHVYMYVCMYIVVTFCLDMFQKALFGNF